MGYVYSITTEAVLVSLPDANGRAGEIASRLNQLMNAPNKVPQHQRFYQNAYKQHTRLWRINPRSNMLLIPYNIMLWSCVSATLWGLGRKTLGYNSFWGPK
ncbi:hypothetical protein F4779DRAFT_621721 [Xylariaceae sp. FL0662B]|nr:hypothetical protein F4779DRAFT_621721 [Xylariaceae sp. FL0662B]